jgi:hypothetical protein
MEGYCLMCTEFQFCKIKNFQRWVVVMIHSNVSVPDATELYV